jgi:hypothetical protein
LIIDSENRLLLIWHTNARRWVVGEISRFSAACADSITNKPREVNVTEVFRLNRLPTSGDHESDGVAQLLLPLLYEFQH